MPKDPLESITFSSRYLRNSGKKSEFTLGIYNDTSNKFDSSRKFTLKRNWIIVEEAKSIEESLMFYPTFTVNHMSSITLRKMKIPSE